MGEQFRALGDDLVPVASDHLAKGVVDFQDSVFEIEEDRASHALLEREAETLFAIYEGIDGTQLGLDGTQLGFEGGVVCCSWGDVFADCHHEAGLARRDFRRCRCHRAPRAVVRVISIETIHALASEVVVVLVVGGVVAVVVVVVGGVVVVVVVVVVVLVVVVVP
jgi:hypothetical protein